MSFSGRVVGTLALTAIGIQLPALAEAQTQAVAKHVADCHTGTYRLSNNNVVDIAPTDSSDLRWRMFDGTVGTLRKQPDGKWLSTRGWTDHADGKAFTFPDDCKKDEIQLDGVKGHRITFNVTDTTFKAQDVNLAGRLVLPKGNQKVPVVILVHGAEHDSARDSYSLQRMLPAEGVGAFVYDKRGTGASGGTYTQDFSILADDVVAAMKEARRLAGPRAGRVGYQGGSQAGWVLPIATNRAPVDFVIVCFGLAVTVIDEDQEEVAMEMALKGHSHEETAKALEVADAAETVIATLGKEGFPRLEALKAKYGNEPWYKDVHGNFAFMVLNYNEAELRERAKEFDFHTPFHYDPMPTLREVTVPQLWILGKDDLDAPSDETSRRLKGLIAQGHPISLAVFPGAEHGMTEFELTPQGERISTRYASGYFAMMRDFAVTGRLQGSYGRSTITLSTR
jgi:uncharacterized protein